jgi:hypothetical protein
MMRYYFHCVGNDDDGTELPDDATARMQARETFGEMIRDGAIDDGAHMDVTDETGRRVMTLRFSSEQ